MQYFLVDVNLNTFVHFFFFLLKPIERKTIYWNEDVFKNFFILFRPSLCQYKISKLISIIQKRKRVSGSICKLIEMSPLVTCWNLFSFLKCFLFLRFCILFYFFFMFRESPLYSHVKFILNLGRKMLFFCTSHRAVQYYSIFLFFFF